MHLFPVAKLSKSKISSLGTELDIQENVFRLDVVMDYPLLATIMQRDNPFSCANCNDMHCIPIYAFIVFLKLKAIQGTIFSKHIYKSSPISVKAKTIKLNNINVVGSSYSSQFC